MKGIYTVARKQGTALYISYICPDRHQARERIELVPKGAGFKERLSQAKDRSRRVLIKRRAEIVEGRFDLPRSRRVMTVAQFVERHYAEELLERKANGRLRTAETEIHRLKEGPVARHLGPTLLPELDEWKIRKFIKSRREKDKVGPGAINRDLARLSNLWNSAQRRGLVQGVNPLKLVGRLDEPDGRVRYLTPDEEKRLLKACTQWLRPIVEVALHTGIRRGALLGLRWRDIDWSMGLIKVPHDLSKHRKPYYVAMNSRVEEILRGARSRVLYTSPDDRLFPKRNGEQRKDIRNAFRTACKNAELEDFRFHDTRHDCASKIVQAGGTLYDAAEQLGHKTLAMTQRYAHLNPERKRHAADLTLRPSSPGEGHPPASAAQGHRRPHPPR